MFNKENANAAFLSLVCEMTISKKREGGGSKEMTSKDISRVVLDFILEMMMMNKNEINKEFLKIRRHERPTTRAHHHSEQKTDAHSFVRCVSLDEY